MYNCCNKSFSTERGLKIHISRKHKTVSNTENNKEIITQLTPDLLLYNIFSYLNDNDISNYLLSSKKTIYLTNYENYYTVPKLPQEQNKGIAFIKKSLGLCHYCWNKTSIINEFYELPICRNCSQIHLPCITKTTAIKKYLLNEKDLQQLKFIKCKNPHYSCASPMTLFLEKDCETLSNKKYTNINTEIEKRNNSKLKRKETIENNKELRKSELIKALKEKKLKLRNDSYLCEQYIEGKLKNKLNFVVREMCFMKYLHDYTDFQERVDDYVEEANEEYGYYPRGIWMEAHEYIKSKYTLPDVLPWL